MVRYISESHVAGNFLATIRQRTYDALALLLPPGACYELLRGIVFIRDLH